MIFTLLLISVVPERKAIDPEEDSNILPSSKPIPASAILTFVPDNEVTKIVTGPQVENNNSPSSEKQMKLRDRRAAGQDSPYNRKRPVQVVDLTETDGDEKPVDTTEENAGKDTGLGKEQMLSKESPEVTSKGEGGMESSTSAGESGKESKMPSGIESAISNEDQDSTNASKDSSLSANKCDSKREVESSSLSSNNQVVESKISINQNGISTQASSVGKAESSSANSSAGLSITSASVVKDNKPSVAIPSGGAVSHGKLNAMETSTEDNSVATAKQEVEEPVFRLGSEANYSSYINQFTSNSLALTKQQQLEQRDKKRSVTHKFSLNEFKWHGEVCGSKEVILHTLRFSIVGLENSIATTFMHPSWPVQRSTWVRAVHLSKTPQEFAAALSFLQSSIRPICYMSVWNDAVGHVELHRVMSEARQVGTKKKDHKEEEEEPVLEHKGFGVYMSFCICFCSL